MRAESLPCPCSLQAFDKASRGFLLLIQDLCLCNAHNLLFCHYLTPLVERRLSRIKVNEQIILNYHEIVLQKEILPNKYT